MLCKQMGYGLRAEEVITGLINDNRELLENVIGQEEIMHFANLLTTGRDPKMLQFLAALCHTEGRALAHNQVGGGTVHVRVFSIPLFVYGQ